MTLESSKEALQAALADFTGRHFPRKVHFFRRIVLQEVIGLYIQQ